MTLTELTRALLEVGVADPRWEALLILEECERIDRTKILLSPENSYTSPRILEFLEMRRNHIPLQYILGKWDFMGMEFFVGPGCLIPRPDTEILVEKALSFLNDGANVIDLFTGSGCIGISLGARKNINLTLLDISSEALSFAAKNAAHHKVCADIILGDVKKDMPNIKYDLITANPPYIPTKDISALSCEVKNEPFIALDGGEDGFDFIDFLINEATKKLNDGGKMLIEFGFDQLEGIKKRAVECAHISSFEILYDYGKNPRVLIIYK